jgi:putative transposase
MQQLMEADVAAVSCPKDKHDPGRKAVRHGSEAGSVTLGGRRVPVRQPRMRTADGAAELPVPSYELFSFTEILGRMAMQKMLAGISTRRYPVGLKPVGQRTERVATATSLRRGRHPDLTSPARAPRANAICEWMIANAAPRIARSDPDHE